MLVPDRLAGVYFRVLPYLQLGSGTLDTRVKAG